MWKEYVEGISGGRNMWWKEYVEGISGGRNMWWKEYVVEGICGRNMWRSLEGIKAYQSPFLFYAWSAF